MFLIDLWKTTSASTSVYAYNTSKFSVSDASTLFFFFRTFIQAVRKTLFELSRVKLCRNDLRENKNYFELAGGSSYQGVRVTLGKITIKVQRKSMGNRFWFELAGARVMGVDCIVLEESGVNEGEIRPDWGIEKHMEASLQMSKIIAISPFLSLPCRWLISEGIWRLFCSIYVTTIENSWLFQSTFSLCSNQQQKWKLIPLKINRSSFTRLQTLIVCVKTQQVDHRSRVLKLSYSQTTSSSYEFSPS